jgi:hypothetical protein
MFFARSCHQRCAAIVHGLVEVGTEFLDDTPNDGFVTTLGCHKQRSAACVISLVEVGAEFLYHVPYNRLMPILGRDEQRRA